MQRLLQRVFTVEAQPAPAWEKLIHAEQWPSWARHLRRVDLDPPGPVGPNTTAILRLRNGTSAKVRITDFVPGRSFRWEGMLMWTRLGHDHRVDVDEAGDTTIEFLVDGAGARLFTIGRLLAWGYARSLDRAIPRLQAELSRGG